LIQHSRLRKQTGKPVLHALINTIISCRLRTRELLALEEAVAVYVEKEGPVTTVILSRPEVRNIYTLFHINVPK